MEYLVLGHFERKERDEYGIQTMVWMLLANFDGYDGYDGSSAVSKQEVGERLTQSWTSGRCWQCACARRPAGYARYTTNTAFFHATTEA